MLIDRKTSKPGISRFSSRRSLQTLARTVRRTLQDGCRLGRREIRAFCLGYQGVVRKTCSVTDVVLRHNLFAACRRETGRATEPQGETTENLTT